MQFGTRKKMLKWLITDFHLTNGECCNQVAVEIRRWLQGVIQVYSIHTDLKGRLIRQTHAWQMTSVYWTACGSHWVHSCSRVVTFHRGKKSLPATCICTVSAFCCHSRSCPASAWNMNNEIKCARHFRTRNKVLPAVWGRRKLVLRSVESSGCNTHFCWLFISSSRCALHWKLNISFFLPCPRLLAPLLLISRTDKDS